MNNDFEIVKKINKNYETIGRSIIIIIMEKINKIDEA